MFFAHANVYLGHYAKTDSYKLGTH